MAQRKSGEIETWLAQAAELGASEPVQVGRYWLDFLVSAGTMWLAIAGIRCTPLPWLGVLGYALAVLAGYRALSFIHELAHQRKQLGSLEPCWDLCCGIPFLAPAVSYRDVHLHHHRLRSYGTDEDGEYLPGLTARPARGIFIAALSPLLPALLLVRFAVLAPLSWLVPSLRAPIWSRFTQLALHAGYRNRRPEPARCSWPWLSERVASGYAIALVIGAAAFPPLRGWLFTLWCVAAGMSWLNALRALAAHRFRGHGSSMTRIEQYLDSVTVQGGLLSELWAPLGLRYHALHHLCPRIPYHALGRIHRRLSASLPPECAYHRSVEPSLGSALAALMGSRPRTPRERPRPADPARAARATSPESETRRRAP